MCALLVKNLLTSLQSNINAHPRLKFLVLQVLSLFPGLKARLRNIGSSYSYSISASDNIRGPEHLSLRARKIYFALKTAIEQRQKDKH